MESVNSQTKKIADAINDVNAQINIFREKIASFKTNKHQIAAVN